MVKTSSQQITAPWGIHWFRRDLRLKGNRGLLENLKQTNGRTVGLFCFDSLFLSRPDFSHNRFALFMNSLKALRDEMRALGGDLLLVDCLPQEAFGKLLHYFERHPTGRPQLVTWNRDYEPFARNRDRAIFEELGARGIPVKTFRDHVIFEPNEVQKSPAAGDFYQVFTPYSKRWLALFNEEQKKRLEATEERPARFHLKWDDLTASPDFPFHDSLDRFITANQPHVSVEIPDAGSKAVLKCLKEFLPKADRYQEDRDFPAIAGTSKFSMYLKNGSLSSAEIIRALQLPSAPSFDSPKKMKFMRQIVWREFYFAILFHRPDVETQSFLPQFRDIQWENDTSLFNRWMEGTTGFPIVDAGMRELRQTGWMHNRVRMIVASFLCKDLLIDWRWGEQHFMKYLLDGDLAANNGGWQWSASTGVDPQPYFRIFNPWLQSKKFDPDGIYIKKFVPELRSAPVQALHSPDADRSRWKYPDPIVDHNQQRNKALALYSRKE